MRRRTLEAAARATTPAQPPPDVAVTVRHLDDGRLVLIPAEADEHLLNEAAESGGPLLVQISTESTPDRPRVEFDRGLRALGSGPVGDAHASLLLAADLTTDQRLGLTAILAAADAAWSGGDRTACLEVLEAARCTLNNGEDSHLHDHILGMRALLEQRPADALAPLRRVLAHGREVGSAEALHRASVAALLLGDIESACSTGERALATARSQGSDSLAAVALEYLAYAELRAGRHARARAHAHEGLCAVIRSEQTNAAAHHRAILALAASVEGDCGEVVDQAGLAASTARRHGLVQTRTLAEWALARVDLGRGRSEAAASRLADLVQGAGHFAVRPLLLPCFIEAAVMSGRITDARRATDELVAWSGFGVDRASAARLVRCRALLEGTGPRAETMYRRALELHAADPGEFELARTGLLYGNWLRRHRRPRDARAVLRDALHGFERCGARAWADRARMELRATGEPTRRGGAGVGQAGILSSLTPHQLRIARLVATGSTNREAAQMLSISMRTVEHHLRNIFAELGVRSRVELARMVSEAD